MNTINDGGPAFPRAAAWSNPGATSVSQSQEGISLRVYFAMHAPADIPEWFTVPPPTPKPAIPELKDLPMIDREHYASLRDGTLAEAQASLGALGLYREFMKADRDLAAWYTNQAKAKYFAWRWFYADQMLATASQAVVPSMRNLKAE